MYTPSTSSIRYSLPRADLRAMDRRSGAYPTKARTGDSTRKGNNKFYFDDTRSVVFDTNVHVSLPTTFHTGSNHLASDLTSSFTVVGDVKAHAVDQWINHREQTERPGPFVEHFLYEQNETNVVNSRFMTGAAYNIASDRFKSKLSNKTIIRLEFPLTTEYAMNPLTSSLGYLNPTQKTFQEVVKEHALVTCQVSVHPAAFAPLPFTPYGFHYLPLNNSHLRGGGFFSRYYSNISELDKSYPRSIAYEGEGYGGFFAETPLQLAATASVANPTHAASSTQAISLSDVLSMPFLLEKVVIEFPFKAGAGWLNDRFEMRPILIDSDKMAFDAGGPMVTVGLMRQDRTGFKRDLIASGTITNQLDMITGSYYAYTGSNTGFKDIVFTPTGVRGVLSTPTCIITGSTLSGSSNTYTGSIKMELNPQVTSHILRMRASGSATWFLNLPGTDSDGYNDVNAGDGAAFSPSTVRSNRTLASGRNILGNSSVFVPRQKWDPRLNNIHVMDSQFENLGETPSNTVRSKLYLDVVSNTATSPYLLYPQDELIVCLSKHRAVALTSSADWTFPSNTTSPALPNRLSSNHDVAIPTGTFRITLYGDLIKEDREFHDTLNQRLETAELWETIGEEPVLDQFDVTYANELSGSFLDRNNIFAAFPQLVEAIGFYGTGPSTGSFLTSSILDYNRDVGHLSDVSARVEMTSWGTLAYSNALVISDLKYYWLSAKQAWELRKSHKNVNLRSDELFWDTRLPHPEQSCRRSNTEFCTINESGFPYNHLWSYIYAGDVSTQLPDYTANRGIRDWYMTYPYEPRNTNISYVFFESLGNETWANSLNGQAPRSRVLSYDNLFLEVGVSGSAVLFHGSKFDFAKVFYGIGDGVSTCANQYTRPRRGDSPASEASWCAEIRGWRYGMMNAFPLRSNAVFRRNHYGHFRDMLEQRVDAKFYDRETGAKEGPVQVKFYDAKGKITDPLRTLSSNLSYEATSSIPYTDERVRNRAAFDLSNLNITTVAIST